MNYYGYFLRLIFVCLLLMVGLLIISNSVAFVPLLVAYFVIGMTLFITFNKDKYINNTLELIITSCLWVVIVFFNWSSFDQEDFVLVFSKQKAPDEIFIADKDTPNCSCCGTELKTFNVCVMTCSSQNSRVEKANIKDEMVMYCPKCFKKPLKSKVYCINDGSCKVLDCPYRNTKFL